MDADQNIPDAGATPSGFDNEMAEILESFVVEANEILERLNQDLLDLEKRPDDKELHNTIFRAVHTIKGTSSFLGFEQMTELAHKFEDVLNKVRKGELPITSDKMDVMFVAYDFLKILLQRLEAKNKEPIELSEIITRLEQLSQNEPAAALLQKPKAKEQTGSPEPETAQKPGTAQRGTTVAPAGVEQQKGADSTIRVDVSRLDTLMNLVGELVLGRNRLSQITHQMNEGHENLPVSKSLAETNAQIDFITTELQMAMMKTRMVPIAKVFNKLPRLVRDLAKEMSKEIDLQIYGEETELDKTIIEELNDPLVHIIRNAADHGIDSKEERQMAGKPSEGTIIVKAEHEGNHIVISIQDNGRGMDPERIKRKAVEKGLITEAQAAEMTKREVLNLIFAPGFSTAEKVTNVSGRGVGMDVVRTNITKLKGIVDIESEVGKGSIIIIKLPLTLAIIQGLLVKASEEIFSVPLGSVLEVARVRKEEICTIHGREVIRLRELVLPLARLGGVLGVQRNGRKLDWYYVVVVGLAEERLGLVVDSLLGQREVVIKALGGYLGNVAGIAGSTILGDGRVIMIVDVGQIMQLSALCAKEIAKTVVHVPDEQNV